MSTLRQFVPRSNAQLQADYRNDSDGPFTSRDQLVAAMSDSRYAHDPAYRAKVEVRMAQSDTSALGFEARFHAAPIPGQNTRTFSAPGTGDDEEPGW